MSLLDPLVYTSVFVGAVLPFLFMAMTMRSVGDAAFEMIEEVRRQFREIPGIMEGTGTPDYAQCVAISTNAASEGDDCARRADHGFSLVAGFLFGVEAVAGIWPVLWLWVAFWRSQLRIAAVRGTTPKSISKRAITVVRVRKSTKLLWSETPWVILSKTHPDHRSTS